MPSDIHALLLAPDIPFPPNRGGRADVWRRAVALRSAGSEVSVAFPGEPPDTAATAAARDQGIRLVAFARQSEIGAVSRWALVAGGMPLFVHRRMPTTTGFRALLEDLKATGVNVVVSEGPWLWELGRRLAAEFDCPLVYRSHNIEHRYMKRQAQLERSRFKRAWMSVSFAGLERFERRCIRRSDMLLDISADDLGFWGHPMGRWLPPLPSTSTDLGGPRHGGVVFIGNLRTPNNIAGLRLLLGDVMPRVRLACPSLAFFVVGSSPSARLEHEIEQAGAKLFKNVDEPMDWMRGADCLVNPVMDGSGVQLKMLDMLQTDRPVVTFAQGVRGLPPDVAKVVEVVTDAAEMARAILRLQVQGFPSSSNRAGVRAAFSVLAFRNALAEALSA